MEEKKGQEIEKREEDQKRNEAQEESQTLPEVAEETEPENKTLEEVIKEDGITTYENAEPREQAKMEILAKEIKVDDPHTVIFFGAKAQENINRVADSMLEGVKNKDLGNAGDALNQIVKAIRDFDVDELNPNRKQGFFSKLFGFASPIERFIGEYEEVRKQIDAITDTLEQHKTQLLTDITALDRLYDVNFDFFKDLELYIAAGLHRLKELDEEILPKLEAEAGNSRKMQKLLKLKEIRQTRDDLERRIYDLRLSRQVAMQSLPSIRLVQENDKSLVSKISSTLVNTVPLWKNQLAQAITIHRSAEAANAVKEASDLTNELLEKNAENLQEANREVRTQIERGVYDIESIKKANQTLIDTINESLEIAKKGKEAREAATRELEKVEHDLQEALLAAGRKRR